MTLTSTSPTLHHRIVGDGMPLLLVHGFTVDHRLLTPFERLFTRRSGWQRIYVDLPGFGRSPRLPGRVTADTIADSLSAFIDEIVGDRPFAVLGNSFGGQLARHLVAERGSQVKGVALLCPLTVPLSRRDLPHPTVLEQDSGLLAGLSVSDAREFTAMAVHQTAPSWDMFRRHALPGIRLHDRTSAAELWENFTLTSNPETRFATHTGPGLLITARQDHIVGWRDGLKLLDSYPHMTAAVIDGAGHNAHLEQPDVVYPLVAQWLDRVIAATESAAPLALTQ